MNPSSLRASTFNEVFDFALIVGLAEEIFHKFPEDTEDNWT